jgi:hypothetical protein
VNLGRIDAHGVELVGGLGVGRVTLGADATLQNVRGRGDDDAEVELEYEPEVYGGLWAETPLLAELRLGFEAQGMGEQRYLDLDSGDLQTLAPSVRFDVRLSRSFAIAGPGPWQRVDATVAARSGSRRGSGEVRPAASRGLPARLHVLAEGSHLEPVDLAARIDAERDEHREDLVVKGILPARSIGVVVPV